MTTGNVRPKKALGQHFLTDTSIARRIADTITAAELPAGESAWGSMPILEVGPGMGVLTQYLLAQGRPMAAVELDSESIGYLFFMFTTNLKFMVKTAHICMPNLF